MWRVSKPQTSKWSAYTLITRKIAPPEVELIRPLIRNHLQATNLPPPGDVDGLTTGEGVRFCGFNLPGFDERIV